MELPVTKQHFHQDHKFHSSLYSEIFPLPFHSEASKRVLKYPGYVFLSILPLI